MNDINKNIFRAYDIRGIFPDEFDEKTAYLTAKAFCKLFKNAKNIAVGGDFRLSTPSIKKIIINALAEEGKKVFDVADGPSPVFRFALVKNNCDNGIMITASHNPKEYNGLKIMDKNGYDYTGETGIYKLYELAKELNNGHRMSVNNLHGCATSDKSNPIGSTYGVKDGKTAGIKKINITEKYIKYLTARIKLKKPLKIILDTGNGACHEIPERIFKNLGCEVKTLFKNPDGNFPNHIADPHREENLKTLQKEVLNKKANLGIAYDGDGDRIGIIDNLGKIISGDHILMMLARQALKFKKGNIVFEIRAADALIKDTENHGGRVFISKAGRSYVIEEIIRRNAVFGGELTGHLFFSYCYYNFDDGILAGLKIAEIASEYDKFSDYIDTLPKIFVSKEIVIEIPDEIKFQKIEELKKYLKKENYDVVGLDGIKINFENGSALVRASNTAPQIKIIYEGKKEEDKVKIGEQLQKILEKFEIKI